MTYAPVENPVPQVKKVPATAAAPAANEIEPALPRRPKRVPAEPFAKWLRQLGSPRELAARTGRDEAQFRRWIQTATPSINETTVEKVGLELGDDPRLTEQLYPHLAEAC